MEKPILFNTAMVRAILEDRKTSTRRPVKRTPSNDEPCGYGFWKEYDERTKRWYVKDYTHACVWWTLEEYISKFGKYHVGDILWVRETWKRYYKRVGKGEDCYLKAFYGYKADENINVPSEFYDEQWKPSIHMPKAAARLFLKVAAVRIERLQDISEQDALNEGIKICPSGGYVLPGSNYDKSGLCHSSAEMAFRIGFGEIYPKIEEENPWVWVIEFEKM